MRSISPFRANQNTPRRTSAISAKVAILLCLIAIATASTLWAIRKSPSADVKPTNVLLITMDTTRADHLGCYGHPANVTPNIDAIANEGVLFEQCMSSAPSTLPSHSAIMTSTHPFVHGARDNIGYRLSQSNTTLAEVFQEKGFKTAAFVSAAVLNRHTGIDQGFSLYVDAGDETEILGQKTCDRAIEWIRAQTENPFFAWVHFYDPHFVYEAPANFVSTAPNAYLREIAYMDAQIGRIFDELKRLGHYDDTLIVLIADHGEGLGQHGENTHLYFLYNTTISVPFVMRCPQQIPAKTRIGSVVRSVDVAPTVLSIMNSDPLPIAQGTDLTSLISGSKGASRHPAYAETIAGHYTLGTSILRSLRVDNWKYIHAPRPELYNIDDDPVEMINLADKMPEKTEELREELRSLIAESPELIHDESSDLELSASDLARLESLGYVGGDDTQKPVAENEMDLFEPDGDDPKDHAADFEALSIAQHHLQHDELVEAEASFRKLADEFPDVIDLKKKLARSIFRQNRFDEPLKIYESLCEAHPDNAGIQYGFAKLLGKVGRRPEAITHFATAVRLDPEYAEAYHDLAIEIRDDGHAEDAIPYFRQAIRARPSYIRARVNLARLLLAQSKVEEAIEEFRGAVEVSPDEAELRSYLAFALLKAEKFEEAKAVAQQALKLDPNHAPAKRLLIEIEKAAQSTQ
ncbi:MAG: sulfatase-like hydrolase/transferase [Phycisphaerales bacterium]|nr:sulfatase-like hydrolase/transferase [Phycisphaerales bacterium]